MRFAFMISVVSLLLGFAMPVSAAGFSRVGSYYYYLDGIFTSARISALGGSDLADGSPAALLQNQAPLAMGDGAGVSYDHTNYVDYDLETYAVSAEWNAMRLNVAVQDFSQEGIKVRTAYNPEGTGETFDSSERMTLMGLSYDLGKGLFHHPAMGWSVGGVWRHYDTEISDTSGSGDSFDLGSTLAWTRFHSNGWTRIAGVVSWQNIADGDFNYEETEYLLPGSLRTGLTFESAWDWEGHERTLLKILAAYNHCNVSSEEYDKDSDHRGIEAVLLGTIAVRWGNATRVWGDISSWGVGLILDKELLGPFSVKVDWGQMGYDSILNDDNEAIWGLRVGYAF